MKQQLIDRLHAEGCSCVIYNNDHTHLFHKRGVQDLHQLLRTSPDILRGAMIADKVVGKGAAVLMTAGGVRWVYADVISQSALEFMLTHNIEAEYGRVVPNIINRAGTDICPVEKLCMQCEDIEDALTLIDEFIEKMRRAG
ncbi:MAG: DUF1893 domain-containing protein [Alistipes sp.]|nr:DUF1893 domain-containing protein [Alistipes sp.]